jgi:hypothetical protein
LLSDDNQSEGNGQVVREILQYLVENPDAKDTTEGILKWWLGNGRMWRKDEVQKAVDFMTSKGWLTKRKTSPKRDVYGINKDRLQEIRSFLQQSGDNS